MEVTTKLYWPEKWADRQEEGIMISFSTGGSEWVVELPPGTSEQDAKILKEELDFAINEIVREATQYVENEVKQNIRKALMLNHEII